jgi:hypothetical protein
LMTPWRHQRLTMPRVLLPPERAIGLSYGGLVEGAIGMAGALLPASVERGEPLYLLLDNGEQMDDPWAHDERGLCPTGGIERKLCWQGD